MRALEQLTTADNTLNKNYAPTTHTTSPTEQSLIFTQTTELKKKHTSPRVSKPIPIPPPQILSDIPSSLRVPLMKNIYPRVQKAFTNPTTITDNYNTTAH